MVKWAPETTGLAEFARQSVSSLSGGQAQRVWIAMALAQGSKVLLLDEPTTYLDVRYQLDILRLVRRLNEEFGMTVVMVLHDLSHALEVSDRIVVIKDGKKYSEGPPSEVITSKMLKGVYNVNADIVHIQGRAKPLIAFAELA